VQPDSPVLERLDKWLFAARIVRTRTMAQELVRGGGVRLNGVRVESAGRTLKAGDVLTVRLAGGVRVMEVLAYHERRGAAETSGLYREIETE
jgi:ribosome-associated heat shock protein Hsp15